LGQQPDAKTDVLAGLIERVHNPENGFCVLRLKARGHRDLVTTAGHAAMISAGEWVAACGEWTNDRTHGQQFRARFLKTSAPLRAPTGSILCFSEHARVQSSLSIPR
jgi:exodeoxyribonuclease V alpha subunit